MSEIDIDSFLKEATSKKQLGDIDGAIISLKRAYEEISKTQMAYPVETYLRLPLYLQAAKKNDEAWGEFNKLIAFGYPNQTNDREIEPFDESTIYDKMRLFLQREGKHQLAITFGIYSYLKMAIALQRQKRNKELSYHRQELKDGYLLPLLKKAKQEHLLNQYLQILEEQLKNIQAIDFTIIKNKLSELHSKN